LGTFLRREEIADQRRGSRRAGSLTETDTQTHDEELRKARADAGGGGEQAPHEDTGAQDARAVDLVGEAAERQPDKGVDQSEGGAQGTERGVAQLPLLADVFPHRSEDLAVEEIH